MLKVGLTVDAAAQRALLAELRLFPKPGLVSLVDAGAHRDMDHATFSRSIDSLRGYFESLAEAGGKGAPFHHLQDLGRRAEQRMLKATGGINTHRGALFTLGLLAASAGWCQAQGQSLKADRLAQTVARVWGPDIEASRPALPASHGSLAVARFGVRGARSEAAAGFPTLLEVALPALRRARALGADPDTAGIQCLFEVMAVLDDTNLLHRGGIGGLVYVQGAARAFLERGGTFRPGWVDQALDLHRAFIQRNLSPGGAADLLAAAWFLRELEGA